MTTKTFTSKSIGTNISNYWWDFGDGTPSLEGFDKNIVIHEFQDDGVYTISHKVYDECGESPILVKELNVVSEDNNKTLLFTAGLIGIAGIMLAKKDKQ